MLSLQPIRPSSARSASRLGVPGPVLLALCCLTVASLPAWAEHDADLAQGPSQTFGYGPDRHSYLESLIEAQRQRSRERSQAMRDSIEARREQADLWAPPAIQALRRRSEAWHQAIRSRSPSSPLREEVLAHQEAVKQAMEAERRQLLQDAPPGPPTFGHGPYGWAPYGWPAQ